ncbi:hypothetical protein CSPAE12_06553 [Colletotrichum incanum]|nr:hypothetical protein CSPAE12_06553 [Colletotrichum incanum]
MVKTPKELISFAEETGPIRRLSRGLGGTWLWVRTTAKSLTQSWRCLSGVVDFEREVYLTLRTWTSRRC